MPRATRFLMMILSKNCSLPVLWVSVEAHFTLKMLNKGRDSREDEDGIFAGDLFGLQRNLWLGVIGLLPPLVHNPERQGQNYPGDQLGLSEVQHGDRTAAAEAFEE